MTSLHIEHTVNDLELWLETFRSFDDFRAKGGVKAVQVRHEVDNPNYVAVDLDFETQIWPNAPHFDGVPTAHVFETI